MKRPWISALAVVFVATVTVVAGEVKLDDVQCVVASRGAQESKAADYKDAKVYFCCGNCLAKFESSPKKFTDNANRQLVQTGQYTQKACPFSGGDINPETALTVAGAKVAFCCNNCKGKVAAADAKEKIKLVFNDKAFKNGFEKAKPAE